MENRKNGPSYSDIALQLGFYIERNPALREPDQTEKQEVDALRLLYGLSIPAYFYLLEKKCGVCAKDIEALERRLKEPFTHPNEGGITRRQAESFIQIVSSSVALCETKELPTLDYLHVAALGLLGLANGSEEFEELRENAKSVLSDDPELMQYYDELYSGNYIFKSGDERYNAFATQVMTTRTVGVFKYEESDPAPAI